MVRAVIFDCFGVLISDALSVIVGNLQATDHEGAEEIRHLVGLSNRGLLDPAESNKKIAKILGIDYRSYRRQIADGEVKDLKLMAYIRTLRPHYKTAMLSNISSAGLHRRFSDTELNEHFDVVVPSGEIGFAKPEPEAYEIVADRLGMRLEECIFIDDREDYCQAAQGVGMQAIYYQDFGQMKRDLEKVLAKEA